MLDLALKALGLKPHDVFVSYRTADRPDADRIAAALRRAGFTVFLDHDSILGGQDWRQVLVQTLAIHRVAVCLVSPGYGRSEWTRHELDVLLNQPKLLKPIPLVPLMLRGEVPRWVATRQYVDFRGRGPRPVSRVVTAVEAVLGQQDARRDLLRLALDAFADPDEPSEAEDGFELRDDPERWATVVAQTVSPLLGKMWDAVYEGTRPRHKADRQRDLLEVSDPNDRYDCLKTLKIRDELQAMLKRLGEPYSGTKDELVLRLLYGPH